MFKKVASIFDKSFEAITSAAFFIGMLGLLNQLIGIFRERLFAKYLGVSNNLDVYIASFKIPDLIFVIFGALFSVFALLPYILEYSRGDHDKIREKLSKVFTVYIVGVLTTTIIVFILMPFFIKTSFSSFSLADQARTILYSRIMLLSPILMGASSIFGIYANYSKKFLIISLSPILYNLGIILGFLVFYKHFGVMGIVLGVIVGAFLHFLVQVPIMIKNKLVPKLDFSLFGRESIDVFKNSAPRAVSVFIYTISLVYLTTLASKVGVGGVSILSFAYVLQGVPYTLIGNSFAQAAFPVLSILYSNNEKDSFVDKVNYTLRQVMIFIFPTVFGFMILRFHLVKIVLGTHSFSFDDFRLISAMLYLLALSVIFQSISVLFSRVFHASMMIYKTLWANLFSNLISSVLAFFFINYYEHFIFLDNFLKKFFGLQNIVNTKILLVGFAFLINYILVTIFYLAFFKTTFRKFSVLNFFGKAFTYFIFSLIASALGYLTLKYLNVIFRENLINLIIVFVIVVVEVAFVYISLLFLAKEREAILFFEYIKKPFLSYKTKNIIIENPDREAI